MVQGFAADIDAADATLVPYALRCRPATCFGKRAKLCVPIYKPSKFFIRLANGTVQYGAVRTSHANCSCNDLKKGDESTLLQRPKLRSAAGVMCPTSPLSLSASHWSLMAAARAVRQREATAWRNSAFCRHGVKVSGHSQVDGEGLVNACMGQGHRGEATWNESRLLHSDCAALPLVPLFHSRRGVCMLL